MKASNKKPIDGLGQERRNSSALAMELCLSCIKPLQWRHNGHYSVSNHQPHDCLLNHLFRRISKKTSKLRVTGLCAGKSLATGEFPAQMASNVENVSIWWCHHAIKIYQCKTHWGHWMTSAAADVINHNVLKIGRFKPCRFWNENIPGTAWNFAY